MRWVKAVESWDIFKFIIYHFNYQFRYYEFGILQTDLEKFDFAKKFIDPVIWGVSEIRASPFYLMASLLTGFDPQWDYGKEIRCRLTYSFWGWREEREEKKRMEFLKLRQRTVDNMLECWQSDMDTHLDFEPCCRQFPLWVVDSDFSKVEFIGELSIVPLDCRQQKDSGWIREGLLIHFKSEFEVVGFFFLGTLCLYKER